MSNRKVSSFTVRFFWPLMLCLGLGLMALVKMWRMDCKLTLLALIPAAVMFVLGTVMSQVMTRRWEERQQAFSDFSSCAP